MGLTDPNPQKQKMCRQKTYAETTGRVYYCNNFTSSNAWFEGDSLRPWEVYLQPMQASTIEVFCEYTERLYISAI